MTDDPLDKIFDSPQELEGEMRNTLARMLLPFAAIDPESGVFYPKSRWHNLNAKQRVLIYFLARLALSAKNPEFKNQMTSKEVVDGTELPGGTVRPKISELAKDRVVVKNPDGSYLVRATSMSINNAWELLEKAVTATEG